MQSDEIKTRFGRCPYCRAMIYQNPTAIYYCNKCRTPIRGKNPEPTDDNEHALSQLEILSADTVSVFSDELDASSIQPSVAGNDGDQPQLLSSSTSCFSFNPSSQEIGASYSSPHKILNSVRSVPRTAAAQNRVNQREQTEADTRRPRTAYTDRGSPLSKRVNELRPSSRRRRPSNVQRDDASSDNSDVDTPRSAYEQRWQSPLSSQEFETWVDSSEPEPGTVARSPLTEPAFQNELLQALDNLRNVIAAVQQPKSSHDYQFAGTQQPPRPMSASYGPGSNLFRHKGTTGRDSRLFRRLESQLAQASQTGRPPRNASVSSSASSSSRGERRAWKHHCRPTLGGAPFVVCGRCTELLQVPVVLSRSKITGLQCGGCGEMLALTLPASGSPDRPDRIFSAPQPGVHGTNEQECAFAMRRLSGDQQPPELPLHRAMGYSSPSPLLQSRRY